MSIGFALGCMMLLAAWSGAAMAQDRIGTAVILGGLVLIQGSFIGWAANK